MPNEDAARPIADAPIKHRRGEATRRAILDNARTEFAAKGFAGGSMRSIARSLGIELAHIQHHFRDKNTLWAEVLSDVLGRQKREFDRVHELNRHRDPDEALCAIIDYLIRYAASHPDFVALLSQARTSPFAEEARAYRVELGDGVRQITDLIVRAQATGRFVRGNPSLLFYQFVGAALRIFTAAADAAVFLGRAPSEPDVITLHIQTCISIFMPGSPYGLPGDDAFATVRLDRAPAHPAPPVAAQDRPSVVYLIGQLDNVVSKGLNDSLRDLALTQGQMIALVRIAAEHRPSAAKLARLLDVTPQSMMMMVKSLEAAGFIRRRQASHSKRILAIELTAAGYAVLDRLRAVVGKTEQDTLDGLTDDDRLLLNDLLIRLVRLRRPLALSEWSPLLPSI